MLDAGKSHLNCSVAYTANAHDSVRRQVMPCLSKHTNHEETESSQACHCRGTIPIRLLAFSPSKSYYKIRSQSHVAEIHFILETHVSISFYLYISCVMKPIGGFKFQISSAWMTAMMLFSKCFIQKLFKACERCLLDCNKYCLQFSKPTVEDFS